jgi:ADP-heptose:LPS heptosyltransferase
MPAVMGLRKRHPGACFIYNCHPDSVAIPRLYNAADRVTSLSAIGLVGYWYRFLTGGFYMFHHGDPQVVRSSVRDFCDQFQVPPVDEHLYLAVPETLKARARQILKEKKIDPASFVTIHTGPTLPVKEWPREQWAKLVAGLQERGFTQVVQLGVGFYYHMGKCPVEPIPGTISLMDQLTLEESLAIIQLARLHVGVDSGLLHIAAAVRTPAVAIFGHSLPEFRFAEIHRRNFVVSQVECRGCAQYNYKNPYLNDCPHHIRCMKEVGSEEVVQACLRSLNQTAGKTN